MKKMNVITIETVKRYDITGLGKWIFVIKINIVQCAMCKHILICTFMCLGIFKSTYNV